MLINSVAEYKAILRNGPYAWPGGYPLFLLCDDGGTLCYACGKKEVRQIFSAIADKRRDGWRVVACDANWEDTELTCDHCGKAIELAYGAE